MVQAHCYTKYLGHLELRFDEAGDLLVPVDGVGVSYAEPILLDDSIEQDPQVLKAMEKWQQNLTEYKEVLGYNVVYMEERRPSEESNIGQSGGTVNYKLQGWKTTLSFCSLSLSR